MGVSSITEPDQYGVPMHGSAVVASALAGQLGSDPRVIGKARYDMRRLSVITDNDIPLLIYAEIRSKKSSAWGTFLDMFLNLKTSVGGRGRRDIIKMEQVSHGVPTDVASELEAIKPGFVARHTTKRDWKEKAEREGKV